MNGTEVKLYYDMILRVPTAGGGYQDKIFQEEELHRPLIDANNTVQPVPPRIWDRPLPARFRVSSITDIQFTVSSSVLSRIH